jgi:Uma2 family endonuclease
LLPEVLNANEQGNSLRHNRIKLRLTFLICLHIESKSQYEAFDGDQNIYIPKYKNNVYPDISVVTEVTAIFNDNKELQNPSLIIEVLSNSTEHYDRSGKFRKYQSLPSFQEYVLVNQYAPIIDVLTKTEVVG